ncbi:MAG: hypothetical protein WD845_03055 [Pirellulales bacterium]
MSHDFFIDVHGPDQRGNHEKLKPLFEMALREPDALPCALLCASFIDRFLLDSLKYIFVPGDTSKELLKPDSGLIGSLYNRARIAYVLGLIDSTWFTNIRLIAEIRNKFAHSPEPLTFESDSIVQLCKKLVPRDGARPGQFFVMGVDMFTPERLEEPRARFLSISLEIAFGLMHRLHRLVGWKAVTSRKGVLPPLDQDGRQTH